MTRHYENILVIAGIITVMGVAGQFDYEEEACLVLLDCMPATPLKQQQQQDQCMQCFGENP